MNLGEFMKLARKRRRVTLMQMAEATGISYTMLARIETHQLTNPSPHILKSISQFLTVSYPQLLVKVGYLSPDELGNQPNHVPIISDRIFLTPRPLGLVRLMDESDRLIEVGMSADFSVSIEGVHAAPFSSGYVALLSNGLANAGEIGVLQQSDGQLSWVVNVEQSDTGAIYVSTANRRPVVGEVLGWVTGLLPARLIVG